MYAVCMRYVYLLCVVVFSCTYMYTNLYNMFTGMQQLNKTYKSATAVDNSQTDKLIPSSKGKEEGWGGDIFFGNLRLCELGGPRGFKM